MGTLFTLKLWTEIESLVALVVTDLELASGERNMELQQISCR